MYNKQILIKGLDEYKPSKAMSGGVIWFTGLSGSGKSTLMSATQAKLARLGQDALVLDGDVLRQGLCGDLGFDDEDRRENIRRAAWLARHLAEAGHLVLCGFITPFNQSRDKVRAIMSGLAYGECYVKCCVSVCAARDPKGLYRKAARGEISRMSGLDAPFEVPASPDLIVDTEIMDVERCVMAIKSYLEMAGIINPGPVKASYPGVLGKRIKKLAVSS